MPDESELDTRLREGKVLVGSGPAVTRRMMGGTKTAVAWYLDPAEPDQLWCALGDTYTAWLWIPVSPEPAALAEVLAHSHPAAQLTRQEMTGLARGYIGAMDEVGVPNIYTGELVPLNGPDLDRYFVFVDYVEQGFWGSSCLDDPRSDDAPLATADETMAFEAEYAPQAQLLGRIPSMTWRTAHSRSYVSFEIHGRQFVCVAVRYRPSPASHHDVVARLNRELGWAYPLDLPLDAIGALTGFYFNPETRAAGLLSDRDDTPNLIFGLNINAAIWAGDQERAQRLRDFADHTDPDVRLTLARIATCYDYRWLAEDLARTEPDPDIRDYLTDMSANGASPDPHNVFGDHFEHVPVMIDSSGAPVTTSDDD